MKIRIILAFVLLYSGTALGQDIFSMNMDEFYQVKKHEKMYTVMKASGNIKKARAMLKASCIKHAKDKKTKEYCKCSGSVTDNANDRLIMFDSIISYKSFKAKVSAKQSGNIKEYQRLKKLDLNREGLSNLITAKCGKI